MDGVEIIKMRFELAEKNKSRKFYSRLNLFLHNLVDALKTAFPDIDSEIRRLFRVES